MLRKGIVIAALCLMPALAHAQSAKGPFELELGGTGANGPNFNGFTASVNGSVGFYFTDVIELSLRQTAGYSDIAGVAWNGSTRLAIDANIPLGDQGQITPYIGANIGYAYGSPYHDSWEAAPEAGIKFYVTGSAFIYFSVEYQFLFNQHSSAAGALSKGEFLYGLGIGVRL
jgi:hypothetical protein